MPDRAYLHPIDPELIPGARNATNVCLRLKPKERVTIITDEATREIAAALQTEVESIGSQYSLFVLEHHARRPLKFMPEPILEDLATSQASIFAAQTQTGELGARIQMTSVVNNYHIRHGHMVNINREIMLEGMRADFVEVDALSQRLVERARRAGRITCKTPNGTEFEAELSSKLKWLNAPGHAPWQTKVDLTAEGATVTIEVPRLTPRPDPIVAPGRADAIATATTARTAPGPRRRSRVITGLALAGGGMVATGVGVVFGVQYLGLRDDARAACGGSVTACTGDLDAAERYTARARQVGLRSSVLIGVGAAAVGAGLVVWLTAPRVGGGERRTALVPTIDGEQAGVTLLGSF